MPDGTDPLPTSEKDDEKREKFLNKEFEFLWKDVEARWQELKHIETFGLGGVFAIMAWLLAHRDSVPQVGWFLPFLIAAVCGLRAYAVGRHFRIIAEYMKKIEEKFLGETTILPYGWNRFFWDPKLPSMMTNCHYVMWGLVLLAVFLFGLVPFVRPDLMLSANPKSPVVANSP